MASFEGVWSLDRRITHADGAEARLSGEVRFYRVGTRMLQLEEGELLLPQGETLFATRKYQWLEMEDRLECLFEDGRPFHTVPLRVERPETTYLCSPDRYHVRYDFSDWPRWQVTWEVTGPKKDYRMVSPHTRIG